MIAYAEVGHPEPPSSGASDIQPRRFRGLGGALSTAPEPAPEAAGAAGSPEASEPSAGVVAAAVSDSCRSVGPGSMQLRPSGSAIGQSSTVGRVSLTRRRRYHGRKPQLSRHSDNMRPAVTTVARTRLAG